MNEKDKLDSVAKEMQTKQDEVRDAIIARFGPLHGAEYGEIIVDASETISVLRFLMSTMDTPEANELFRPRVSYAVSCVVGAACSKVKALTGDPAYTDKESAKLHEVLGDIEALIQQTIGTVPMGESDD